VWPQQASANRLLRTAPKEFKAWVAQVQSREGKERPVASASGGSQRAAVEEAESPASIARRRLQSDEKNSVRSRLYAGEPLDTAARQEVWSELLPQQSLDGKECSASCQAPPCLVNVLTQRPASPNRSFTASFQEISVGSPSSAASASSPSKSPADAASTAPALAEAFAKKYLTWLPKTQASDSETEGTSRVLLQDDHVFLVLAQLLCYHFPPAALAIEAVARSASIDLPSALAAAANECGIRVDLFDIIFEVPDDEDSQVLLLVCDLTVLVDEDMLLLFVMLVGLGQMSLDSSSSFDQLLQDVRSIITLQTLNRQGFAGACECVSQARALLRTTPWSLSCALSPGNVEVAPPRNAVCQIAPEEVLHHAYETPGNSQWRLLVVDARMRPKEFELPVCVPLQATTHSQRRKFLSNIPDEECIHMCIMGDSEAQPGDDAFELCYFMCGALSKRRHMSVVRGGWPAIQGLATTLNLTLLPSEDSQASTHGERTPLGPAAAAKIAAAEEAANQAWAEASEAADRLKERVRERAGWALQSVAGMGLWPPFTLDAEGMVRTESERVGAVE